MFKNLNIILGVVFALVLILLPRGVMAQSLSQSIDYYQAEVLSAEMSEEGSQDIVVKIANGDRIGEEISFTHYPTVIKTNDNVLEVGNNIYISIQDVAGEEKVAMADYNRSLTYALMAILFVLVLLGVGLLSGLRALVGFGLLMLIVGTYLIPQILGGNNPIVVVYMTAIMVVVGVTLVIAGFSRKALLIIVSSLFGLVISSVIIFLFGYISNFRAIGLEETHLFALSDKLSKLNLLDVIYGGMLLGTLGAMMDVSMSIVAGVEELLLVNREKGVRKISQKELFHSGLKIGREIMAVNANTLLLAYIGSALTMWLVALSQDVGLSVLVSFNLVFVEVLRMMGGTLGIFISIPMTAYLASRFLIFKRKFDY